MLLERSESIAFWAWRVALEFKEKLSHKAADMDLTAPEAFTLTGLHFENGLPLAELSKRMHHSHTSVLRHVDSLESRGLVIREPHPEDRRIKLLQLTKKSRSMMPDLLAMMHEVYEESVKDIPSEELHHSIGVLKQVITNLGGDVEVCEGAGCMEKDKTRSSFDRDES
ncbi:MarR family transcriptional regulator [bacterium]|nr:MarR family transcriptional regulator [bacterium]